MRYSNITAILTALLLFSLLGCSGDTNEKVDITAISETCTETITTPSASCEEVIYGQITDEWLDRIDTTRVKLNHYIDDEMLEENLADIFNVNDALVTQNPITIPEYSGQPMKHVLIVEFWQIK